MEDGRRRTLEDKEIENRFTVLPQARRLEKWKPPRDVRQSRARVRYMIEDFRRMAEKTVYELGMEFTWLKRRLPHGQFTPFVLESGLPMRTAQRLMEHAKECNDVNRYLPYAPNKGWRQKPDTVSLLEPPEIQDKSELKINKPRHDREPAAWSLQENAEKIRDLFEKITERRKIEDMEDLAERAQELIREYIESRREDRLMIRQGSLSGFEGLGDETEQED